MKAWLKLSNRQYRQLTLLLVTIGIFQFAFEDIVPELSEVTSSTSTLNTTIPLDINQADSIQLERLPSIGPVLAGRIVKFRARIGCFKNYHALLGIFGWKENAIQDLVKKGRIYIGNCNRKMGYDYKSKTYFKNEKNWDHNKWEVNLGVRIRPLLEWDSISLRDELNLPGWLAQKLSGLIKEGKVKGPLDLQRIPGLGIGKVDSINQVLFASVLLDSVKEDIPHNWEEVVMVHKVYDLNQIQYEELCSIPGIGRKNAIKFLDFRKRIRCFLNPEQLKEPLGPLTWMEYAKALPFISSTFSSDTCYLFINRETEEGLSQHPLIGKKNAKLIMRYREEHGRFVSHQSLLKLYGIKPEVWHVISPYLKFE